MGGSDPEVIVALVALIVSAIALSATCMQVLQQYYASASGYSQCSDKVMGDWARSRSRRFSWEELRFEVQFDAPVIFVSPPTNASGPIPDAGIHFLDGSEQSLKDTGSSCDMDPRRELEALSAKQRIHTADNERASWLVLLGAVQRMEAKSGEWQRQQYTSLGPPRAAKHGLPHAPPTLRESHTLTVALQRKRKSWDTMPASVSKPYATTTMCHLVEMMAALGVYWKEFDRRHDRYRAEGNGFMVLGQRLADLGLIFSFQVYGECRFGRNRVIPVDDVKELCFGYVPTIYRETFDRRRLRSPSDELQNLGSLHMASRREIAETLVVIGCNRKTVEYFLDKNSKTTHLFPLSFEMVGMLGRTMHVENTCFTYIPNPTPDCWDERSLSLVQMMESYEALSSVPLPGVGRNGVIYGRMAQHIQEILSRQDGDGSHPLLLLKALHAALDDADEVLTAKTKEDCRREAVESDYSKLAGSAAGTSRETDGQGRRREVVQDVLRSHMQEVLRLLNDGDDRGSDGQSLRVPEMRPASPAESRHGGTPGQSTPSFDEMKEASPDDRQHRFMEVYFLVIRRRVVARAEDSTLNRTAGVAGREPTGGRASVTGAATGDSLRKCGTGSTHASERRTAAGTAAPSAADEGGVAEGASLADEAVSHDDVWCVLVFRMMCWLMLHDFNKQDVQVSKSELVGSRMPVYVA